MICRNRYPRLRVRPQTAPFNITEAHHPTLEVLPIVPVALPEPSGHPDFANTPGTRPAFNFPIFGDAGVASGGGTSGAGGGNLEGSHLHGSGGFSSFGPLESGGDSSSGFLLGTNLPGTPGFPAVDVNHPGGSGPGPDGNSNFHPTGANLPGSAGFPVGATGGGGFSGGHGGNNFPGTGGGFGDAAFPGNGGAGFPEIGGAAFPGGGGFGAESQLNYGQTVHKHETENVAVHKEPLTNKVKPKLPTPLD